MVDKMVDQMVTWLTRVVVKIVNAIADKSKIVKLASKTVNTTVDRSKGVMYGSTASHHLSVA